MTTVLVIEDELSVLGILRDMLTVEGFDVITATNGQIGLETALKQLPDLIICDVNLPLLDGYGVLQKLHDNPTTTTIPFIFLSARASRSAQRQGMDLGADDYIPKPFTREELLSAIQGRLNRRKGLAQHSAQQLEQLRRSLTMALPHELRTPLQGIMTSAELLGEFWETLDRQEIREISDSIRISASRLHDLIQKFLLYTKLDLATHDPEEFHRWYGQVTERSDHLIRTLAQQIAHRYQRDGDLKLELCPAHVLVSEKWLATLIKEIIDNAFKFSEHLAECQSSVLVKSRINGEVWQLAVKDRGRGMTPEQVRTMGAYMQFDRQQYEQQGTGLGLAIAERIAKIYNGTVTIKSNVGLGTTVIITFPTRKAEQISLKSRLS
ncbi:two-component hybrid sensor and regulator [[Synechococcus] sp. NIES-970]|uniref:hybrid sensor histidine kinase/response regulator n=1 Tax=Picosynechococcus sp. NKBG15041c TaxID=1407650 RepID=UPI0003FD85B7|nr:response regulator [Picosynechococcus sp. NKBG15041c]BAW97321.1 two-component hybrid sensor and regulator [[Synechococcus] sp. NIES-970]